MGKLRLLKVSVKKKTSAAKKKLKGMVKMTAMMGGGKKSGTNLMSLFGKKTDKQ